MKKDNRTVRLPVDWIERLKHYTDEVRNSAEKEIKHKMAIIALLGYLESLEFLKKTKI